MIILVVFRVILWGFCKETGKPVEMMGFPIPYSSSPLQSHSMVTPSAFASIFSSPSQTCR